MLIGLTGAAGSGKSEVARYLVAEHAFMRKPFAERLKRMLSALGVPAHNLDGDTAAKAEVLAELDGRTSRHAMQTLGTEWGRDCMGPDFWVNLWESDFKRGLPHHKIIADDVRFPNEVATIKRLGGLVVRVIRPVIEVAVPAHVSEQSNELVANYTIVNAQDLTSLRRAVDTFVRDYSWAARTAELI